jgi:hypothetical protein
MLGPMQDELYKLRKRKKRSIDGSVPGVPYARYRRSTTPSLGSICFRPGYRHNDYMKDFPQDYTPNINAPAVRHNEYYPESDYDFTPHTHEPMLFRPFSEISQEREEKFDYDKAKKINEILNEIMRQMYERRDALSTPTNVSAADTFKSGSTLESKLSDERLARLFDITDALGILQDALPADHPDVVNLRQVFREMLDNPDFMPTPEDFGVKDRSSNLGTGNPYENDDLAKFRNGNEQTEVRQFDSTQHNYSGLEQTANLEYTAYEQQGMNAAEDGINSSNPEPETGANADNWARAFEMNGMDVFDANPAFGEINHAIDQVTQSEQPQPDPWKQQEDSYNQMIMDPYQMGGPMMPGFGPMPG